MAKQNKAIMLAILAAALYSLSSPFSKILLSDLSPTFIAAVLYLGAGLGVLVIMLVRDALDKHKSTERIRREDVPYVVAMIVLDIAAPILLMTGLRMTSAATVSLLGNFEIVTTAMAAMLFFGEPVSLRLWFAITLITASCIILSIEPTSNLVFNIGSLLVLLATLCWGLENNCTRMLSVRDPMEVVALKGLGSGLGSLAIAQFFGQAHAPLHSILLALLLGFIAYGLSIYFYVSAQRDLGAAKTSAFYAVGPFIGVAISFVIFRTRPTLGLIISLPIMVVGTYLASSPSHEHIHAHRPVTHNHWHRHNDGHHNHFHERNVIGWHKHVHTHESVRHSHEHCRYGHHHEASL